MAPAGRPAVRSVDPPPRSRRRADRPAVAPVDDDPGTVAGWEEWTGLAMPESGTYVLEGGVEPMTLDREADRGVYYDSNVWIVHSLKPAPVQSDAPERWQSGRLRRS